MRPPASDETQLVTLFFRAKAEENRREEFLATLPFVFTPVASQAMAEFLVSKLDTIEKWLDKHPHQPYLHRARFCTLQLRSCEPALSQHMQTMHTATSDTVATFQYTHHQRAADTQVSAAASQLRF